MFYIYFVYLTFFVIPLPLTQQYSFESANKEDKDKILSRWLGVEIDGAYFFDWNTRQAETTAKHSKEEQEVKEEAGACGSDSTKRFISDPPDDCFPVQEALSRRNTADFMRILQRKCWDDLLPVARECSAHSGAERANTPVTCYQILTHVAAFLIVAKLLYML
uniref:4-hydroxy-3-methylbut-2-enyl diphosphate reductase n=1 Tax=Zeugodacus cucurbitae TaxID=28588 RepID=A0A0A1XKU2_ZEUCU